MQLFASYSTNKCIRFYRGVFIKPSTNLGYTSSFREKKKFQPNFLIGPQNENLSHPKKLKSILLPKIMVRLERYTFWEGVEREGVDAGWSSCFWAELLSCLLGELDTDSTTVILGLGDFSLEIFLCFNLWAIHFTGAIYKQNLPNIKGKQPMKVQFSGARVLDREWLRGMGKKWWIGSLGLFVLGSRYLSRLRL